jgi:hypothetical protein
MVVKGQADYSAICNFVRIDDGAIVWLRGGTVSSIMIILWVLQRQTVWYKVPKSLGPRKMAPTKLTAPPQLCRTTMTAYGKYDVNEVSGSASTHVSKIIRCLYTESLLFMLCPTLLATE